MGGKRLEITIIVVSLIILYCICVGIVGAFLKYIKKWENIIDYLYCSSSKFSEKTIRVFFIAIAPITIVLTILGWISLASYSLTKDIILSITELRTTKVARFL